MHGHSRHGILLGGSAALAAVAILVLVPSHRSLAAVGATFFVVLALKHVALAATVALPAAVAVRRLRPRARRPATAPFDRDADGYFRTGAAEPHRGVLRLEHDVRELPAVASPQALITLDADKRMTLRFLSPVDAARLRDGLAERYRTRGDGDAAAIARFLSPITGPIAKGDALVVAYEAATQTTYLTLRGQSAAASGREHMEATWRLWFDTAAAAALADALMANMTRPPGATLHSPRFYDLLATVYTLGRERRMRQRTLDVAGVAAGERVLDVCCGTGTLALAARDRVGAAGAVQGIDASPEMIARARQKSARRGVDVDFAVGAAQSLPFADGTFDVVLCSLALHHLDENARAAAIAEMGRVVKPGGRVIAIEFGRPRGLHLFLHPAALAHARRAAILDGVVEQMTRVGLERVASASLSFAGLRYAIGHRRARVGQHS